MPVSFDLTDRLRKRVPKLARKDRVLALVFKRKLEEVINRDTETIDAHKNLRSPQNEYKRAHLTGSFVLLFAVDKEREHILFVDSIHWDKAYR